MHQGQCSLLVFCCLGAPLKVVLSIFGANVLRNLAFIVPASHSKPGTTGSAQSKLPFVVPHNLSSAGLSDP